MKNDARKMALENQIELAQQNAIDFTHACMTIALHDVFGVGKDRLDKVTQRKDEINGELMRRMAIPAKNQKAQLNEAEKWLVGLLPEGVVSVFRVPVIKGVPRKRREVQLKMAIDRAAIHYRKSRFYLAEPKRVMQGRAGHYPRYPAGLLPWYSSRRRCPACLFCFLHA